MGGSVVFYSCKGMNMCIGGPKLKTAMNAKLIFPILGVSVSCMRLNISHSCTRGTPSPMSGFICMDYVLVIGSIETLETATVADFIAIGSIDMLMSVCFLITSCTDFPVHIFVAKLC